MTIWSLAGISYFLYFWRWMSVRNLTLYYLIFFSIMEINVHQFFLQTRRWHFLENAIRLWLHCPPAGCSCVPMFAVLARDGDGNISRQILTVPHLAGGRDHAHTGTVSLHSLGVLKLLSNLFDDCNFLIWKGRWYRTCEKLAVLKLKFRPPARCQ